MLSFRVDPPAGRVVKPRPGWLKALGTGSLPDSVAIGGVPHRLRETFKHDSWAATGLYEGPSGALRVVKLHRQSSVLGIPMGWLGRRMARHEIHLLSALADLKGLPALAGQVTSEGCLLGNAVARNYIEGHPLGNREDVNESFYPALRDLLRAMHERKIVYVDLHKRENILVNERGEPCLIDFQISVAWPRWLPPGPLFTLMRRGDEYHLMKHWSRSRPEQCGFDEVALRQQIPWPIRAHRLVARPFRELRRRLLVKLGVRSGKGRVETELFAEHALREPSRSKNQPARRSPLPSRDCVGYFAILPGQDRPGLPSSSRKGRRAMSERPPGASGLRFWPWAVLALTVIPAVWYVLDFENDIDPELPGVVRPTFSLYPPAAYRFAEACDTIDHVAVYVSSAALVLAAWGWFRNPRQHNWAAATALSAAGFWHASTPGPLADGWYGLGWRTIFDPRAPAANRLILAGLAAATVALVIRALRDRPLRSAWTAARTHGILGLLIAAAILMVMRQVGWLDWEPIGFWPRWCYVWGLFAWAFALVRVVPAAPRWPRALIIGLMVVVSLSLDFTGRGLFWYQRPIARLREVVPGRLYLSAMPTYRGLTLAQERYHFRTIINLYPEYTPEQSPHWDDELRFVRERGLKYVGNESRDGTAGEDFIGQTLELSQNPETWPILVHCHASMDRSPAWVGIYRFVVQRWPLADALCEIERHRGLRPKAAVTVLYTQILPKIAPERCVEDPTFALLKECASVSGNPASRLAVRPGPTGAHGRTHPSAQPAPRR